MDISPKQVMDLRAATGLPMMKCKQALVSEEGDFEKAMERLRKEGLKAADKKADRATGEGLVRLTLEEDGSAAALVAVVCETEPVRNTPMFQEFVDRLLVHVERYAPDDADAVLAQPWIDDPASTVDEVRRGLVARLGENIQIQRVLRTGPRGTGVVGGYVHFNGKIADGVWLVLNLGWSGF